VVNSAIANKARFERMRVFFEEPADEADGRTAREVASC
jgi:hypothetical protein